MRPTSRRLAAGLTFLTFAVASIAHADDGKPNLQELVKVYDELGLPYPPKDARLVRYKSGGRSVVNGVVQPGEHYLAFEVPSQDKEHPRNLLMGLNYSKQLRPNEKTFDVPPTKKALEGTETTISELVLALQCSSRGWAELAQALYARSQHGARQSPLKELYMEAWYYWDEKLCDPKSDRAEVARRLKGLLVKDKDLDNETNQALLKSLDLTLARSKSAPGSVDALIDSLTDFQGSSGGMGFESGAEDEGYKRLAQMGFDAVPKLIEHLDDERLTRGMMQGFNNFHSFHLRIEHVVSDILEGLAGQDLKFDWLRRQQGWTVEKDQVVAWWKKVQTQTEEKYLLDHYFDQDEGSDGGRNERIRHHRLLVLRAKYPKRIPDLYRTLVNQHREVPSWKLCQSIADMPIPVEDKIALLSIGIANKDIHLHQPALVALRKLDADRFDKAIVQLIEHIPHDTNESYWISQSVGIAGLADWCNDPAVWPLLEKVARRSSLGLKMEILHCQGRGVTEKSTHFREILNLWSHFLDDETVRDSSTDKRLAGPSAGFLYKRIQVRDAVALDMARHLNIEVPLKPDRTEKEWAEIRAKVRKACDIELAKPVKKP